MSARNEEEQCRFCLTEPDDWCPGCGALLCPDHSRYHKGSLDLPCKQTGPELSQGWVEHCIQLGADQLDAAGVGVGRLGVTDGGRRAVFRCIDCRRMYTVTGPPSVHYGISCLADNCSSYDISRDVDIFFEPAMEAGIIRRTPKEPS